MPDTTQAPKIRIVLKTGQKPDPEPPMLRFLRWKLVPLPADLPAVEPDVHEEPGHGASSTRTP